MNNINIQSKQNSSKYACNDSKSIRLCAETNDIRTPFFRDVDKIVYSLSYTRYIDKAQVFIDRQNDNISKRSTHVQMVSRIARTIGRALGLNEDLIEAASLGHDLGHTPFGHVGESILNEISLESNQGYFFHNVQSVRNLMCVENDGKGLNITLQVLDAILCHNGEVVEGKYCPQDKSIEQFFEEYNESYKNPEVTRNLKPMTLEGCVVRISDVISYIGRDIEDAIRLGVLKIEDIPKNITNVLGHSNSEIINTLVIDVIENSKDKNYIKLSPDVFEALNALKDFNYKHIYNKANSYENVRKYKKMLTSLFNIYLKHVSNKDTSKDIYTLFLNNMDCKYLEGNSDERKVLDFIVGMTDDFVFEQYKKYVN